jgi:hypothetical protein
LTERRWKHVPMWDTADVELLTIKHLKSFKIFDFIQHFQFYFIKIYLAFFLITVYNHTTFNIPHEADLFQTGSISLPFWQDDWPT